MGERRVDQWEKRLGLRVPPGPYRAVLATELARVGADADNDSELDDATLAAITGAVVSGHTYFFRDADQLGAVVELLGRCTERPRLWCAGCSTGEEPYSVAILAAEAGLEVDLVATDINPEAVAWARAGRYPASALRHVPPELLARYFRSNPSGYLIDAGLRERVQFEVHDLFSGVPPAGGLAWDVILCRNVLIYYQPSKGVAWAASVRGWLKRDGGLVLGASDHLAATLGTAHQVRGWPVYRAAPAGAGVPDGPVRPDLYRRALDEIDAGDPAAAENTLATHLARRSGDVVAWLSLGNLHLSRHDFVGAERCYREALALAPTLAEAHFWRGVLRRKQGDQDDALRALRAARFLAPEFWPAAALLGSLWNRRGDRARGRAEHERALALLEGNTENPFQARVRGLPGLQMSADELRALARA